jgi:hypothetical protein
MVVSVVLEGRSALPAPLVLVQGAQNTCVLALEFSPIVTFFVPAFGRRGTVTVEWSLCSQGSGP